MPSEAATIQTAMDAMMAANELKTVSANDDTTRSLGVNTWTGLPEGLGAVPLAPQYLKNDTTDFYFCWDASGYVYPLSDDTVLSQQPGKCP